MTKQPGQGKRRAPRSPRHMFDLVYFYFIQDIERIQRRCENSLSLLKKNEINLSTERYDASESKLKITLVPEDEDIWKSHRNKSTSVVCCSL